MTSCSGITQMTHAFIVQKFKDRRGTGGTSLYAFEQTMFALEDDPTFNAGTSGFWNCDIDAQLEALIIGVADDGEARIKTARVRESANGALQTLGFLALVDPLDVEVIAAIDAAYRYADAAIKEGIYLMTTKAGLIADPVYEGRAIRGVIDLNASGRFTPEAKVLLMHLGGSPAIHAYAGHLVL